MSVSNGMLNILPHAVFVVCSPVFTLTIKEYPVFEPNEYFFKKHWDEKSGEEKWEAYARVIRKIMSDSFNFKLTDQSVAEKHEYKKILKGSKIGQKFSSKEIQK